MTSFIRWSLKTSALAALPLSLLLAQESPKPSDESFEVEPPILVQPEELVQSPKQVDLAALAKQLEHAKKSAAAAERLVRIGALAQAEAEQRQLRAVRLESELAKAQLLAAEAELAARDHAPDALAEATATAKAAEARYHQAEVKAAANNLRRQRLLLTLGSARKSDVARAEEKLAQLQQESAATAR